MTNRRSPLAVPLILLSCCAAGCGAQTYQDRIEQNSRPFFAHQSELDSHLGARVQAPEISLRLPKSFRLVPARQVEEGETDPRLPEGFDGPLPGLLAAYRGPVKAMGGPDAPGPVDATAYAFLLSNRELIQANDEAAPPDRFGAIVHNAVSQALGYEVTAPPAFGKRRVGGEGFARTLTFDTGTPIDAEIRGVPMKYELYLLREAGLTAGVLFVLPAESPRTDGLKEAVALSLETVEIKPTRPTTPAPRQSASGSPGGEAAGTAPATEGAGPPMSTEPAPPAGPAPAF